MDDLGQALDGHRACGSSLELLLLPALGHMLALKEQRARVRRRRKWLVTGPPRKELEVWFLGLRFADI